MQRMRVSLSRHQLLRGVSRELYDELRHHFLHNWCGFRRELFKPSDGERRSRRIAAQVFKRFLQFGFLGGGKRFDGIGVLFRGGESGGRPRVRSAAVLAVARGTIRTAAIRPGVFANALNRPIAALTCRDCLGAAPLAEVRSELGKSRDRAILKMAVYADLRDVVRLHHNETVSGAFIGVRKEGGAKTASLTPELCAKPAFRAMTRLGW